MLPSPHSPLPSPRYLFPNFITAINIFCGVLGIVQIFKGNLDMAIWAMCVGMLCDFADGLVARMLKGYSEFGKQLDSLADLVTFGVLPMLMLYDIFSDKNSFLANFILLYAVFSALRLAKFNIDTRQTDSFIGLPTPASALAVVGYVHLQKVYPFLHHQFIFFGLIFSLCVLMVCELPLFALKFKTFSLKDNLLRYLFLITSLILIISFQLMALLPVVGVYIFLSVGIFCYNCIFFDK